MNEKLKTAYEFFYKHDFEKAKEIFIEKGYLYEAGVSAFLSGNLDFARKCFEEKQENCIASSFALSILNLIEHKQFRIPTFFQIRAFYEIFINLFIETGHLEWAQKVIDNNATFQKVNFEVPKFTARVLNANDYNRAVHSFCKTGKELCFYDAEVHYIDAYVYTLENNYKEAIKCINDCLSFAPEYFPIITLKETIEARIKNN